MGLGKDLDKRLREGQVVVEEEGRRAEVEVLEVDRLGARIGGIRVVGEGKSVKEAAEKLPDALRMLPERVVPVEVDTRLGGAILRSDRRDIQDRGYFEARSDGKEATLERLSVGEAGRGKVPFTLTREQLGRLVDGMLEALEPEKD
jgi:hypothetical protein